MTLTLVTTLIVSSFGLQWYKIYKPIFALDRMSTPIMKLPCAWHAEDAQNGELTILPSITLIPSSFSLPLTVGGDWFSTDYKPHAGCHWPHRHSQLTRRRPPIDSDEPRHPRPTCSPGIGTESRRFAPGCRSCSIDIFPCQDLLRRHTRHRRDCRVMVNRSSSTSTTPTIGIVAWILLSFFGQPPVGSITTVMTAVPDSTDRDPPAQLAADRHCRRQKMLALRPNSRQPQLSLPQSTTLSSSPLQALSFPTTSWSCGTTGPTQAYKLHHRAPCWLHFVHLRRRFTSLSPLMCLPSSTLSSPTSMEPIVSPMPDSHPVLECDVGPDRLTQTRTWFMEWPNPFAWPTRIDMARLASGHFFIIFG